MAMWPISSLVEVAGIFLVGAITEASMHSGEEVEVLHLAKSPAEKARNPVVEGLIDITAGTAGEPTLTFSGL